MLRVYKFGLIKLTIFIGNLDYYGYRLLRNVANLPSHNSEIFYQGN